MTFTVKEIRALLHAAKYAAKSDHYWDHNNDVSRLKHLSQAITKMRKAINPKDFQVSEVKVAPTIAQPK